jgi:hypothetical protein
VKSIDEIKPETADKLIELVQIEDKTKQKLMLDLFHDLVKNAILEPAASAAPVL